MHARKIFHAIATEKALAGVDDAIVCQGMRVKAVKLKQSAHRIALDTVFAVVKLATVTPVLLVKHVDKMQKKQERKHVYQPVAQQTAMAMVCVVMALVITMATH
jgi:hypothetical protein